MGQKLTKYGRGCPAGTGGHQESETPSKVWSRALDCWSTAISKSSFTKKISVTPPPPPPPQWRNDRPCYPCYAGGRHLRGAAYYQTYRFLNEKSFDKVAKCSISRPT